MIPNHFAFKIVTKKISNFPMNVLSRSRTNYNILFWNTYAHTHKFLVRKCTQTGLNTQIHYKNAGIKYSTKKRS